MQILVVDFYDSFVYNLVHYIKSLNCRVKVLQDEDINPNELKFLEDFDGIFLSPGPGLPQETRSMLPIIAYSKGKIPIFGVCLGMQGLGLDLGGSLKNLNAIAHGSSVNLNQLKQGRILQSLPDTFAVGLYHSWVVDCLSDEYIFAKDERGIVMAIECNSNLQYGVQFHPESILTENGMQIVRNVLSVFLLVSKKNKL